MASKASSDQQRIPRIKNALLAALCVMARYEGTEWEAAAIGIFERVERELENATSRTETRLRAVALREPAFSDARFDSL